MIYLSTLSSRYIKAFSTNIYSVPYLCYCSKKVIGTQKHTIFFSKEKFNLRDMIQANIV